MIEWEKLSNFASRNKKSPRTYIRCKSDSPSFQVRFKSVPYIKDIADTR